MTKSRHGSAEIDWADGTHTFRLGLAEIEELERKRDKGIFQITQQLQDRTCRLSDISEVLRIGLVGGGMQPVDALALVRRYVDERPIEESRDVAYAVCLAGLMRLHTNETEKPPGEAEAAKPAGSTSPPSEAAQP